MKVLYLWIVFFIFAPYVFAHDGVDELRDLKKNKVKIIALQKNIKDIGSKQDRLESLSSQLNLFQRNILILRNKMIEESPQIKSSMSKYDIDYMREVDFLLKKASRTLKDTKKVLHE